MTTDFGLFQPTPTCLRIKNFVTLYVLCFCQCFSCINIYTIVIRSA